MPQVLKYIDQIAREKQRDVLYLEFNPERSEDDFFGDGNGRYSFEDDSVRTKVLDDLTKMGVTWKFCGPFADENFILRGYDGQVYVDVPYDKDLPLYQQLESYLEHPDGTIRFPSVRFYILTLSDAMNNAHYDEPGFWEKLVEDF